MSTVAIGVVPAIAPEERLRADLYALFSRLFFAAPDAELLRLIGGSPLIDRAAGDTAFLRAWQRLSAACSVMDADAAHDEYETLFGGIGRSAISLFATYYVGENAPGAGGTFLVDLRDALQHMGLGRQTGQNLPEDHLAAVLETMRLLIERGGVSALDEQRDFFRRFLAPWAISCCDAISRTNLANFYQTVAECLGEFVTVEKQSFDIG